MFRCESDRTNARKSSARLGHRALTSIHQARIAKGAEAEREPMRGAVVRRPTMHCHVGRPAFPILLEVERIFFPDQRCRSHDASRYRSPKAFLAIDSLSRCHRKVWRLA